MDCNSILYDVFHNIKEKPENEDELYERILQSTVLKIEEYIRTMIRQDNEFVFDTMLSENWEKWLSMKKCYYRGCIYSNYLIFLNTYCVENESYKCKQILTDYFLKQGMSKNQHKKNAVKYIRWKP
jgi:predicted ABC-type ATPase